jgi:hypothetical protein
MVKGGIEEQAFTLTVGKFRLFLLIYPQTSKSVLTETTRFIYHLLTHFWSAQALKLKASSITTLMVQLGMLSTNAHFYVNETVRRTVQKRKNHLCTGICPGSKARLTVHALYVIDDSGLVGASW